MSANHPPAYLLEREKKRERARTHARTQCSDAKEDNTGIHMQRT